MNNKLLNNNPSFSANMQNAQFNERLNVIKQRKLQNVNSVKDLNLTQEQLTKYVIAPIKIEKSDRDEVINALSNVKGHYNDNYIKTKYWANRTNQPYKRITGEEHWKNVSQLQGYDRKTFNKKSKKGRKDMEKFFKNESKKLVIHHASKKDTIGVMDEYEELLKLFDVINGEIEAEYAPSKEAKHKLKFMKTNKLKYKVRYDPKEKDYNDLADYYKKQERKYNKNSRRADSIIDSLLNDDLDEEQIKAIEAEYYGKKKSRREEKKQIERDFKYVTDKYGDEAIDLLEKYGNDAIDIIKEYGRDARKVIENAFEDDKRKRNKSKRDSSKSSKSSDSPRNSSRNSSRSDSNRKSYDTSNRRNRSSRSERTTNSESKPSVTIKRTRSRRSNNVLERSESERSTSTSKSRSTETSRRSNNSGSSRHSSRQSNRRSSEQSGRQSSRQSNRRSREQSSRQSSRRSSEQSSNRSPRSSRSNNGKSASEPTSSSKAKPTVTIKRRRRK
jgi:hypothetical protein